MGIFTWSDCTVKNPFDQDGEIKNSAVVNYGGYAKLICPDDTELETTYHDTQGTICGYDIYELVAEWNRFYLSTENLSKKPSDPTKYCGLWSFEKDKLRKEGKTEEEIEILHEAERHKQFCAAVARWEAKAALIDEYKTGASEEYLEEKYGDEWKREIGIAIACEDECARKLKYPIKLTKDKNAHGYDSLYISYSCQ